MVAPKHSAATGTELHEDKRIKQPVRAASVANVTISGPGTTLDGVTLSSGDRILLKDQTTTSQNGIYVFNGSASAATRATDAALASDFVFGFLVYVREGTANVATNWQFTQSAAITLGTTALTFGNLKAGALNDPTTTRGDLITRSASALARLAIGAVGRFLGTDGVDAVWTNSAQYYRATGLPGATAGAALVGGTVSGSPVTGTFGVNDIVPDSTGKLWLCTGAGSPGTWVQTSGTMTNPMTTNQDIITGGVAGAPARVAVGANGQVLTVTAGVVGWAPSASGFGNPMTSAGDMISATTGGAAVRVPIGANTQVLTVIGGLPGWANPSGGGGGTTTGTASSLFLAKHYV